MDIENLIGCQLVSINESQIKVKKDNKEFTIKILEDYGGCCGYNKITTELLIDKTELQKNPIITNVELVRNNDFEDEWGCCGETGLLTFFGEYKPLAKVNTISSSGSGWQYGACVTLQCDLLNIDETVSRW